jgi:hypothetical protein
MKQGTECRCADTIQRKPLLPVTRSALLGSCKEKSGRHTADPKPFTAFLLTHEGAFARFSIAYHRRRP